jgi:glycosyltransferase involved in cell wall biosynthesis
MNEEKKKPIYMLVWGDTPDCATGFSTVIKNVFTPLANSGKYEIDIIGINDRGGWKDPNKYPFRIYPAKNPLSTAEDFHGRPRLIAALAGKDPEIKPPWDIVFCLNDPFILEETLPVFNQSTADVMATIQETYKKKVNPKAWFKTVAYWPIDSVIKGNWVQHAINKFDETIAYTNYGIKEIEFGDRTLNENKTNVTSRMKVIYHGYNPDQFKPLDEKTKSGFRKQYFENRLTDDTFIVTVIARNQMRKDIPRAMAIFKEFQKRRPDSFLYIHAQESDVWGSLKGYASNWHLELGKDWGYPASFSANTGFPVEAVNLLYNVSNCVLSTTLGEGFGFYNFEGMATKTVVVAPNNTCHPELHGYDAKEDISDMDKLWEKVRGVPIKCASTSSEWATFGVQDLERPRPLVNVDDAVKKLVWVYDNPDKVKAITDRAYDWVKQYEWSNIVKQWDDVFTNLHTQLEKERAEYKPPTDLKMDEIKPIAKSKIETA